MDPERPPLSAPQAARGGANPEAAGRRVLGWGVAQGQPTQKLLLGWGSRVHGKARRTKTLTTTHALPSLSRGPFHFLYPTQGQPSTQPRGQPRAECFGRLGLF